MLIIIIFPENILIAKKKGTSQQIKVDETVVFDFAFTNNIVQYSQADRDALKKRK